MAPVFGYWSLRGLGEPIRHLLAYTGTKYDEKTYDIGPPPTFDRSGWINEKEQLGLDLPNLPYWIDGDTKITESRAILRHLARRTGLDGTTEQEKIRIDVAESVLTDLFRNVVQLVFSNDALEKQEEFRKNIDTPLQKCSKVLGPGPYIAGQKISYVDFMMLEQLDRYDGLAPGAVARYPSLSAFQSRVTSLPAISAYRNGAYFQKIKTRFYGRMTKLGSGEESYK